MNTEDLRLLRDLLRGQRLLSIAVLVEGEPVAGLLPFLAAPSLQELIVHTSGLARHTAGLGDGRPWSAVIHRPDAPDHDPLATARLTLQGQSYTRPGEDEDPRLLAAIRAAWLQRFPSAELTVDLGDFAFQSLTIAGGRLVGGFAAALNLTPDHLAEAAKLA